MQRQLAYTPRLRSSLPIKLGFQGASLGALQSVTTIHISVHVCFSAKVSKKLLAGDFWSRRSSPKIPRNAATGSGLSKIEFFLEPLNQFSKFVPRSKP